MDLRITLLAMIVGYLCGAISFARLITQRVAPQADLTGLQVPIVGTEETSPVNVVGANTASMILGPRYGCLIAVLDMAKVAVPMLAFKILYPDRTFPRRSGRWSGRPQLANLFSVPGRQGLFGHFRWLCGGGSTGGCGHPVSGHAPGNDLFSERVGGLYRLAVAHDSLAVVPHPRPGLSYLRCSHKSGVHTGCPTGDQDAAKVPPRG
jgi:hypothetical protein